MEFVELVVGEEKDQQKDCNEEDLLALSPIVRAKLDDLIPAEPLENILDHKFKILGYSSKLGNFDDVFIMSTTVMSDEQFRLNEEILDIAENADLTLGRLPALKEVVLAVKPKDGVYHRAIVVRFDKPEDAFVYFFDVGGTARVNIAGLKPVNKDIMEFPILGYRMILQNVPIAPIDIGLILRTEYLAFMKRMERSTFRLQLGDPLPKTRELTEKKMAILIHWSSKFELNKEIRALKKWEWEKFSNGKGTDNEICEKGKYGHEFRRRNGNAYIATFGVKKGMEFSAGVTRVEPDDSGKALLRVIFLQIPAASDYFDVLEKQMQRYATLITKSDFYPAIDEHCMFKLDSKPAYEATGREWLGRWCRALRTDVNMMYLMDFDAYVPYQYFPIEDYEIRRLYGEFYKIPILTVILRPQENGLDLPVAKASEIFTEGKRFNFKVTDAKKGESGLNGYGVEYSVFNPTPKK